LKEERVPTYQYACNDCGERLEVVQKFTDDALSVCPSCEGNLRKVFSAVGIVFKGSGFYRTDNRAASASSGGSNGSGGKSGEGKTSSDSKPSESKSSDSSSSSGSSGSSSSSGSSGSKSSGSSPAPAAAPA
jgi:putative FmdB family regulatory protein